MRQNPCGKSTLFKAEGGRVAKASSQPASHASDGWAPADRHGHEALLRLPAVIDLNHCGTLEVEKILAAHGELVPTSSQRSQLSKDVRR
jgi:hypothetical protein